MRGALLTLLVATTARAFCPSYTLSSSPNTYQCGVEAAPGTNPTTAQWQPIFDLVAQGPSGWGSAGPTVGTIHEGCSHPMPAVSIPARFPCELLKAITWQESGWRQFCVPDQPADQVGGASRTIISFDCGYGIGQVTSGMHIGEAPAFDRARVASEPTYNLATGTQILAEKWRSTPCVGDNLPSMVEHWYIAAWAYNGLSYSNNPNNPNFSTTRGAWNPAVGGSAPYQEHVWGLMEFPPSARWPVLTPAYPKLGDLGMGGTPPTLPDPTCASPTSCASTRPVHRSSCFPLDAGVPDAGQVDGGDGGLLELPALGLETEPAAKGCGCSSAGPPALIGLLLVLIRRRRE
jgi:MYXO-CTERM domain-containing protein